MNRVITLIVILTIFTGFKPKPDKVIARQGMVSFFSYTTAENIEAINNQVLSIIDFTNNEIAISMLMDAFVFKKSLMYEHFNDSYIESDLYPKATFTGKIIDFDSEYIGTQTKVVKGTLTLRNIAKEIDIKTTITKTNTVFIITGDFNITVEDFNINIPPIVAPNIAKIISTKFKFEYQPYEK